MSDHSPTDQSGSIIDAGADRLQVSTLIQNGQLPDARELCAELCQRVPQDADAWFLLGAIHGQLGDYPAAEQCCRKVIALQPSSAAAYSNLGSALLLQDRQEEAEAAFKKALELNPGDPQTHNNLGNLLRNREQLDEAVESYRKALALNPDFAEASNNLGAVLLMQEDLAGARAQYERALQLQPNYPDALHNLGSLLLRLGEMQAARELVEKALALRPQLPNARVTLGTIYQQLGELDKALNTLQQALQNQPRNPELHARIGQLLNQQGNSQAAAQSFKQATSLKPDFAEAWNGLGIACMHMGKLDIAANAFHHTLTLNPELADARVNLARLFTIAGKMDKAAEFCLDALKHDPANVRALLCLGGIHKVTGQYGKAEQYFQEARRLKPDSVEAQVGQADVLEAQGHYREAYNILEPLLAQGVRNSHLATVFASLSRDLDKRAEAIALLEELLLDETIGAKARLDLHFSLGKLYDETGQYDKAFEQFRMGREQVNDGNNPDDDIALLDSIKAAFSKNAMATLARSSMETERPVFIVGMPRSGSSLVEQILASHPSIFGAGELLHIGDIAASIQGVTGCPSPYPACVDTLSTTQLDAMASEYLDKLDQIAGEEQRVTDKMPYNFMHLGLIEMLFPKARIIHCIRDPLDTCLSCYSNYFVGRHAYTRDLTTLGRYYNKYEKLMLHWEQILKLPILEVSYEELVEDQEQTSRKMVEFCGLDWDPACLEFHRSGRTVLTSSYDQVRRPIYKTSTQRWKHYENLLNPLIKALGSSS